MCPVGVGVGAVSLIVGSRGQATKLATKLGETAIEDGCHVGRKKCKRDVSKEHNYVLVLYLTEEV